LEINPLFHAYFLWLQNLSYVSNNTSLVFRICVHSRKPFQSPKPVGKPAIRWFGGTASLPSFAIEMNCDQRAVAVFCARPCR
jgi:hypothetical protein